MEEEAEEEEGPKGRLCTLPARLPGVLEEDEGRAWAWKRPGT